MYNCPLQSSRFNIINHFTKLKFNPVLLFFFIYTQIYRNYSDNPEEYEMNRLQDSLKSVQNDTKLIVRPARSLQSDEVAVKLSLLDVTKQDFFRPLMNFVIVKGMTVRQFKEQVVEEAYEQGVEVNLDADR
jgi:hypothetical protein